MVVNRGFPSDFIEEVKRQNNIVSVISKYIRVDRKGRTFWACCPFHNEKTPSFAINEEEGFYHCFGCGVSGDVIKFIQSYEGISFYEAVKMLADSANIALPTSYNEEKELESLREKEKVLRALNYAKDFYFENLKQDTGQARDFVIKRGFSPEIVEYFAIGYSKNGFGLVDYLNKKHGISDKTMMDAGLVKRNEQGRLYDAFYDRVVFPIFNVHGDTIGFTARTLAPNPQFAKYVNSAQTLVFDKSKTIYNLHTIRNLRHSYQYIIICEGTIDVIAMFKAGFKNTVACMGTAITSEHSNLLKKYTDKVVLCLDGDSAGQKGALRAIDVLVASGLEVRVVTLSENLDPDEYLKKYGAEKLNEMVENSIDAIEYKILSLKNEYNIDDKYEKSKFVDGALDIIRSLDTNSEREIYLKMLSKITQISIDLLRRDLGLSKAVPTVAKEEDPLDTRLKGDAKAVRFVLASIIHKQEYAKSCFGQKLYFKNKIYQKLYDFVCDCYENNKTFTISSLFDYFDASENSDINDIIGFDFDAIGDNKKDYFDQCLKVLKVQGLKDEQEELLAKFKEERDLNKRREIASKLNEIAKEIKNGD